MSQVSDYNIANASGASVRSDLNAVFDAIKTLNSGGSDPSNTEAFMPYVDTADNNNLKIRNSSNNGFTTVGPVDSANLGLLPVAGGTMTGQLLADDGSGASSPALSFDGDTDTGIYRSAANTMGFSTAGTQRVGISPDLRGEFIRGYDNGRGVDSGRNMLEAQSSQFEQHNHSATSTSSVNDPGHKHTMNFNLGNIISSGGAFGMKDSGTADRMNTATTGISVATLTNIGNTGGSETRPRSIAMMYIIKF
jgi:hypothetical protein